MSHTDTVWQSEEDPTFPDESHWYCLTVRRRAYLPKWVTLILFDSQKKTLPSQMSHTDTVWQSEEPTFPNELHWYCLTVRRRPYLPKKVTLTLFDILRDLYHDREHIILLILMQKLPKSVHWSCYNNSSMSQPQHLILRNQQRFHHTVLSNKLVHVQNTPNDISKNKLCKRCTISHAKETGRYEYCWKSQINKWKLPSKISRSEKMA